MKVKRVINDHQHRHRKKELHSNNCDSSQGKDFKKMLNDIISQKESERK